MTTALFIVIVVSVITAMSLGVTILYVLDQIKDIYHTLNYLKGELNDANEEIFNIRERELRFRKSVRLMGDNLHIKGDIYSKSAKINTKGKKG